VEFVNSQLIKIVMVVTFVLVLLFILGKLGKGIIKRILIGALVGGAVSAFLYYVLHLPIHTVGIIGTITFLISVIFGKVAL
jgi:hypothetical protein